MIIGYFNTVGVTISPLEANAPRTIDRNGPLTLSVAFQTMEANTPQWRNVGQPGSGIEYIETLKSHFQIYAPETGSFSLFIQSFRCSILETLDHIFLLLRLALYVKRRIGLLDVLWVCLPGLNRFQSVNISSEDLNEVLLT